MKITVDLTQEAEHYRHEELEIKTFEDVMALRLQGAKPYQVGAMALVAREFGDAEIDILPENKVLIITGAAVNLSKRESRLMREATMPNGKVVEVREYVAPVECSSHTTSDAHDKSAVVEFESSHKRCDSQAIPAAQLENDGGQPPDDIQVKGAAIIPSTNPAAADRAEMYLLNQVMGDIVSRLRLIAEHRGSCRDAADKLIAAINDVVSNLED